MKHYFTKSEDDGDGYDRHDNEDDETNYDDRIPSSEREKRNSEAKTGQENDLKTKL